MQLVSSDRHVYIALALVTAAALLSIPHLGVSYMQELRALSLLASNSQAAQLAGAAGDSRQIFAGP